MSEEEKSLRDQINEKKDQIEALTEELKEYKVQLKAIETKVANYERLRVNDPNDVDIVQWLKMEKEEKIGMDRKISEAMKTQNLDKEELAKLNSKLEKLSEGMLIIFKYLDI